MKTVFEIRKSQSDNDNSNNNNNSVTYDELLRGKNEARVFLVHKLNHNIETKIITSNNK